MIRARQRLLLYSIMLKNTQDKRPGFCSMLQNKEAHKTSEFHQQKAVEMIIHSLNFNLTFNVTDQKVNFEINLVFELL